MYTLFKTISYSQLMKNDDITLIKNDSPTTYLKDSIIKLSLQRFINSGLSENTGV